MPGPPPAQPIWGTSPTVPTGPDMPPQGFGFSLITCPASKDVSKLQNRFGDLIDPTEPESDLVPEPDSPFLSNDVFPALSVSRGEKKREKKMEKVRRWRRARAEVREQRHVWT